MIILNDRRPVEATHLLILNKNEKDDPIDALTVWHRSEPTRLDE
jgi:hypothetical protein